jgi:PAS domain-containing protein
VAHAKVACVQDLIYTSNYVEGSVSIREVKTWFQMQPTVQALAVVLGEGIYGLITRPALNQHLLYGPNDAEALDAPVEGIADRSPLCVSGVTPLEDVAEMLVVQRGREDSFFTDIVVVQQKKFLGLVSVRDVVVDQLAGMMHRLTAMEAQQAALVRQNKDLFESSFRQSQTDSQFRSYFDRAPVPMAVFDAEGLLVAANPRFARLGQFTPKTMDKAPFGRLFNSDYDNLIQEATRNWSAKPEEKAFTGLEFRAPSGGVEQVSALVELIPDWGYLMVSVMSVGENEDQPAVPAEIIKATEPKPPGKITQAINSQLASHKVRGLARTVAGNLIDKEKAIDRMMKKLETIIQVAGQVEELDTTAPGVGEEIPEDTRQHLKGSLAEFSVIDLCQILIQGGKTGQLLIYEDGSEELMAYIYFDRGQIVHAKHRAGLEGVEALPLAVRTRHGRFDFIFNKSSSQHTVDGDPMGLLMDAVRLADEESGS